MRKLSFKFIHQRDTLFTRDVSIADFMGGILHASPQTKFDVSHIVVKAVHFVIKTCIFRISAFSSVRVSFKASVFCCIIEIFLGYPILVVSKEMKQTNPKYTWREWLVVPAYEKAAEGDYSLIKELQVVFNSPYDEQSKEIEEKYYRLKPQEFFNAGGVSHYSCSS